MLFDLHLLRHTIHFQNGLNIRDKNKFSTMKHEVAEWMSKKMLE